VEGVTREDLEAAAVGARPRRIYRRRRRWGRGGARSTAAAQGLWVALVRLREERRRVGGRGAEEIGLRWDPPGVEGEKGGNKSL
jgi:hypothetical protein